MIQTMTPHPTDSEDARLAALGEYEILDTPPDGFLDRLTTLATRHFRVPISLLTLVDRDRIWFKSVQGVTVSEIARDSGLCATAIQGSELYVLNDASQDERSRDNPLVTGPLGLRFYAAAPLVSAEGFRLGTFNIIDTRPRELSEPERADLAIFGAIAMERLELRLSKKRLMRGYEQLARQFPNIEDTSSPLRVCAWTKKIYQDGRWVSFDEFLVERLGFTVTHGISPEAEARILVGAMGRPAIS